MTYFEYSPYKNPPAYGSRGIYREWESSKIIQLQSLLRPQSEEPLLQEPLQLS